MWAVFLGILMGFGVSVQTVINTRLRMYIGAPVWASTISFTVGTILLLLFLLLSGEAVFPSKEMFFSASWWFWMGGVLGAFWISANIVVFQQLGAVQTAIFPILGQVLTGSIIDYYGLFNMVQKPVMFTQWMGILLVLIGIIIAVAWTSIQQGLFKREKGFTDKTDLRATTVWFWRLFAVLGGAMIACQSAINAQLGHLLGSSVQAAFISFFVGMLVLFLLVVIKERQIRCLKHALGKDKPWWIWMGGAIGAAFVVMSVVLVLWIGVGQMLVLILLGLLLGSLCIDSLGWFGVTRKKLYSSQFVGMAILILGIVLIRLV